MEFLPLKIPFLWVWKRFILFRIFYKFANSSWYFRYSDSLGWVWGGWEMKAGIKERNTCLCPNRFNTWSYQRETGQILKEEVSVWKRWVLDYSACFESWCNSLSRNGPLIPLLHLPTCDSESSQSASEPKNLITHLRRCFIKTDCLGFWLLLLLNSW